nr:MAG TPA: hypothetical protein [Caudoviricetes sp.]
MEYYQNNRAFILESIGNLQIEHLKTPLKMTYLGNSLSFPENIT